MSSEEAYALYYDLLYSHRDVAREVDFLERVFSQCSQVSVRRVLDVGCGTGIHSIELARRGYEVLGVDLSQKMIEVAREKSRAAGVTGVYFLQADADVVTVVWLRDLKEKSYRRAPGSLDLSFVEGSPVFSGSAPHG